MEGIRKACSSLQHNHHQRSLPLLNKIAVDNHLTTPGITRCTTIKFQETLPVRSDMDNWTELNRENQHIKDNRHRTE